MLNEYFHIWIVEYEYWPCSPWTDVEISDRYKMKYMTLWLKWIWSSYHQGPILKSITQPSGDTYLNQPPNQVWLHIWHDLKSPYMTKHDNYYIIGIYMTFTSNDIHEIYNKDQIPKQDHDSYEQISYTIYNMHHKNLLETSTTTTYICPSSISNIRQCNSNINLWLSMSHVDINSSSWPYQYQLAPSP